VSQAGIFAFGCVVFFIVGTGIFLYAMMTVREAADRERAASRERATGR
jgi:hypothetical protein